MAKQYDIPLRLVTPHMRGQAVEDAQYLMAGNGRFKDLATYKNGDVDGDYGPLTAQATRRAKYWVGYPTNNLDGVFGQTLYEYLLPLASGPAKPLPTAFRERRQKRLKAAVDVKTPGVRALEAARKEIGYKEEPRHGVNDNKFGREYGWNRVAWCAIFESIMFKHTGTPQFRYAAVEAIYWDARANRNGLYIVRSPREGDIVGYSLSGSEFAHTAFYVRPAPGGDLIDLGGNTGPTDISNGGMVLEQRRRASIVRYYARVGVLPAR